MSGHAEGSKHGGEEAEVGEEYDDEVICGQCEKPPVKIAKDPRMPTQNEIDEHNITH